MQPSHVIIRGHVFRYADKAPFVASGKSVLGALEYDQSRDQVKCHECGFWFKGLGGHVKVHNLKRAEYNRKHGLRVVSALSCLATRKKHQVAVKKHPNLKRKSPASLTAERRMAGSLRAAPRSVEVQNERAICAAQLLYRVQITATQVGHTPTAQDMRTAGISISALKARFGSTERAMGLAGLQPNLRGAPVASPLPLHFPIENDVNARMPWPKEYFDVEPWRKPKSG